MKIAATLLLALSLPLTNIASSVTPDLIVVIGAPPSLQKQVLATARDLLADSTIQHRVVELDNLDDAAAAELARSSARVVALGADACANIAATGRALECALISAEAFKHIPCDSDCSRLDAVVMDQPLERQIAIARQVYPSLHRFGVLSALVVPDIENGALDVNAYDAAMPLTQQLNRALAGNDALIALPESAIFNRSTLHIVLLTAYGYSKPVIGFSRAYVKAGALISAYTTPEQVLREVLLSDKDPALSDVGNGTPANERRMRPAARFSVVENKSIARSLGLDHARDIDPTENYSDADFAS